MRLGLLRQPIQCKHVTLTNCQAGKRPGVHLRDAMVALTLKYSNLAQHQASIFKQLQAFRDEGQLCDVAVKSRNGTEHKAHKAVLCAASAELKNMLTGPFVEANHVQQGQPVEMPASDAVVLALLEYIYGGQLQVDVEDSLELLRLADAYSFPELAAMIQAELCTALESASVAAALKVLRDVQDLHEVSAACEKKIATTFETCIEMEDFLQLSSGQLDRILRREDLKVSREDAVVVGLFNWFNRSNDRGAFSALLHNIDFQCLSSSTLTRLKQLSASMGPVGHDLQREVGDAWKAHKKRSAASIPDTFQPKRRCLQHWSPDLGASSQAPQKVLPYAESLCCHDGAIYCATFDPSDPSSILCWKPGDAESQVIAGRGARANGVNDLGSICRLSVSLEGDIFVSDCRNRRLLTFRNGSGNVVLSDVRLVNVFCASNGAVYVLTENGRAVEKLVGATLHPLISSNNLPAELQFDTHDLFVTKDEVIYLSDRSNGRVLRISPGVAEAAVVVVGEAPNKTSSYLTWLFVTENEKIYVTDSGQRKVWAFHPSDVTWTEVLTCPGELRPHDILVQSRSLYVGMAAYDFDPDTSGVYEYSLPAELQLG